MNTADHLAAIAASLDAPILSVDAHGRVTSWNRAAEAVYGYTAAEMIARHIDVLIPPADREFAAGERARVLNGEQVEPAHARRVLRDGTVVEHAVIVSPIRSATGDIVGVSELSHRIATPSTNEEAAYQLAAIVRSSDDAIVSKDLNGVVKSWNRAAERLFGYTAAEMVGTSITRIIPPERIGEEDFILAQVRAGVGVEQFETVRVRKGGSRLDVSLTVSPIRAADGRIIAASKIARDITERQKLNEAAYRLAAIVESSDDVIVSKDLNGVVITWNRAAEKLFGYTAEEMIGRSITSIIPEDRLSEEDVVLSKIRAGDKVDHFETIRRRKDGTLVDVSLTVSPVRTRDGRVIGASKIARDITERKRLAEVQRRLAEAEERRRLEMLEAENRRIAEASRVKGEFVANMSHELRTPLHAIIGLTEVWVDQRLGPVDDQYRELGNIILNSAGHLLQLINDILDYAKVESGRIDFVPEPVQVDGLVEEVIGTVGGLATKNNVALETVVDPAVDALFLDPAKLKQVFYNYLSNAIKFSPDGGRVAVRVLAEGRDRFRVEVEDHGIGVAPEDQQRLFVEFQQLDPGTSKRFSGTGLGLALTKRIVEAQGGAVGFRSRPGEGSTFFATLPRRVEALAAPITTPAPDRATSDRTAGIVG